MEEGGSADAVQPSSDQDATEEALSGCCRFSCEFTDEEVQIYKSAGAATLLVVVELLVGGAVFQALEGWDLLPSTWFCMTLTTTVGYGSFAPVTWSGKLWLFVYSFVTIIPAPWALNAIASAFMHHCVGTCRCIFGSHFFPRHFDRNPYLELKMCTTSLLITIFFWGGCGFQTLQGWSYWESIYFSYVTLTTIGLGEYVPENSHPWAQVYSIVFTLWGLGLMSKMIELDVEIFYAHFAGRFQQAERVMGELQVMENPTEKNPISTDTDDSKETPALTDGSPENAQSIEEAPSGCCSFSFRFTQAETNIHKTSMAAALLTIVELLVGGAVFNALEGWGFTTSVWFCMTLTTTVGYGSFTPGTDGGKLWVVVYSFVTIIPAPWALNAIATSYLHVVIDLCRCIFGAHYFPRNFEKNTYLELKLCLGSLVAVALINAITMSSYDGWSYGDSLYFEYVTLTTIGLGDFAPSSDNSPAQIHNLLNTLFHLGMLTKIIEFCVDFFYPRLEAGVKRAHTVRLQTEIALRTTLDRGLNGTQQCDAECKNKKELSSATI